MKKKKIIPFINAENEYPENIIKLADEYACKGADELFIYMPRRSAFLNINCTPCGLSHNAYKAIIPGTRRREMNF